MYIRPIVGNEETEKDPTLWRHAVYIRITFNRLTAKVKSATDVWCTVNEFNALNDDLQELLNRESMFLMDYISRAYTKFEREHRGLTTEEFDVNALLEGFKLEDFELDNIVNQLLIQSMVDYLTHIPHQIDLTVLNCIIPDIHKISPLELLTYYRSIPSLSEFKEKYSDEIWIWKVLYLNFKNNNVEYHRLGATVLDLTHGDFKTAFINSFPESNSLVTKVIDDVQGLINEYYYD